MQFTLFFWDKIIPVNQKRHVTAEYRLLDAVSTTLTAQHIAPD